MSSGDVAEGRRRKLTYAIWASTIQRCHNPNCKAYRWYGNRGIIVCQRWRDSFDNFFADMGERPSRDYSIDRYPDVNGNYEPGNCRWATWIEQARNRTNNVILEYNGIQCTIAEWSERTGIQFNTIWHRIRAGWPIADTLTTRPDRKRPKRYGGSLDRSVKLTMGGETLTITQWSYRVGIRRDTLLMRHRLGWSDEKTLTHPVGKPTRFTARH